MSTPEERLLRALKPHEVAELVEDAEDRFHRSRPKLLVPGLCGRCERAWIIRRDRIREPEVWCTYRDPSVRVPPDIIECSKFKQAGAVSPLELAQMAKLIEKPTDTGHYF